MTGWFELSKSSDDQYHFVLRAGNGGIVLTNELYTTRGAAEKGIASVHANSPLDGRYEKKTASNGKLHFSLKTADHQIIGSNQLYANEQSCETSIASVKTSSVNQTIKDKTR